MPLCYAMPVINQFMYIYIIDISQGHPIVIDVTQSQV